MSVVVARLLRWNRPNVGRPAYTPGHVELPVGRLVTRLGPNRSQVIVGKVVATRDTPDGLEATIRLRDNPAGAETAEEIAAGYLPAADAVLEPLTKDPRTFRPRAVVSGVQLGAIVDAGGDGGYVLSVDAHLVPNPVAVDETVVRPIKPQVVKDAENLIIEAGQGQGSSWWSTVG